jgi:enterochelin esterase-like enzyme
MKILMRNIQISAVALATASMALTSAAQVSRAPQIKSPEVAPDGRVTFRLLAPEAQAVRLATPDIPDLGQGVAMTPATNGTFTGLEAAMTRTTNGIWEVTLDPVDPGAYRYNFDVDGVQVIDPNNPATSESNTRVWSLVYIPGAAFMDTRDVPHGAVAAVTYYSTTLQKFRRMYVYTPPGYEKGGGRFPVLYLLHGLGDCDDSWTSVGRAGFIMDNLIAAKKTRPMIIVMPAGHISAEDSAPRPRGAPRPTYAEFIKDFEQDIMPYAEQHYRLRAGRQNRAIAGLSMGGGQTLTISMRHLDEFAYIGVFSSGLFGITGIDDNGNPPTGPAFEAEYKAALDDPRLKRGLKLVWFATGRDDHLFPTSRETVELLRKHKFDAVFEESPGKHTWINWRNYLNEFAPQLFR